MPTCVSTFTFTVCCSRFGLRSSSAQTELAVCMDLKYGRKTLGVLKNKTLIGIKMS